MRVKLLYFAWVREKTGKAEEDVDLPAGIETVAEVIAWLKQRGPSTPRLSARRGDPRRRRSDACAARGQHHRGLGDRLFPTGDGRLSLSVRVQTADFEIGAEIAGLTAGRSDIGAVVSFTGRMRADNAGKASPA